MKLHEREIWNLLSTENAEISHHQSDSRKERNIAWKNWEEKHYQETIRDP